MEKVLHALSPLVRPEEKPRFSAVDGQRIQRCSALSTGCQAGKGQVRPLDRDVRHRLKAWVGANWSRWNDEKEEWFTSKVISNIPNEFIPKAALEELEKKGRRKSTYVEMLLGGGQTTEVKVVVPK